ncbi:hypothetical protein L1987_08234 [Smallanthus sonchifolius]|uniref:Uncharacterized protein n=1 Tax=Smallanthus sonchifolius TaxID=185202 RepID=A0ACB9JKJ8_9ASTR|nr:hypothetical protein L1987_08234 [Smallanthus sonchifolius]
MDACSLSSFVSHWFAATKESKSPLTGPVFDSAVLFPPAESHEYTRNPKYPTVHVPLKNFVTKRFVFSSVAINKLKHQVERTRLVKKLTRVEVVTSLIWKCGTMALAGDCKASSVAFHVVNFRKKMVPLLQDHQFGNLFQMASAVASYDQTADIASLVTKLRGSFGKIVSEYLKSLTGQNGFEIARGNFKEIRKFMIDEGVGVVLRFSSLCRYAVNEADFGWGKPVWLSMANLGDENCIVFMDSRKDDGIEAWVVMNEVNMQKFEKNYELQAFAGYSNQPTRPSCHL